MKRSEMLNEIKSKRITCSHSDIKGIVQHTLWFAKNGVEYVSIFRVKKIYFIIKKGKEFSTINGPWK